MVNTVLISEAAGKGAAVRKNVLKRLGARIVGRDLLTRGALRAMMDDEHALRAMVHQLMTIGRDVRSTPMQWAYEAKKQEAIVNSCLGGHHGLVVVIQDKTTWTLRC